MQPWALTLAAALGADGDEASTVTGPPALEPVIEALGGVARLAEAATAEQQAGRPWPRPVERPAAVGPAQWSALLGAAERLVGQARAERSGRVLSGRAPDGDEQRLLRDVPPHHGG